MESWETVIQIFFTLIAVSINIYLFHKLYRYFENHWMVLWSSLSSAHVLCNSSLLAIEILTLIIKHYFESAAELICIQTYTLVLSNLLVLFHVFSVAIIEMMMLFRREPPQHNILFILVVWLSTAFIALLLCFLNNYEKETYVICVFILISDLMLLCVYIILLYCRVRDKFNMASTTECDDIADNLEVYSGEIGSLLALSFIVFTIPYSMERVLCHQNGIVSTICVILASIAHGLICLRWFHLKGAPTVNV